MALGILQLADAYSILSWFLSNFSDVFKFYFFFSLENFEFLIEWSETSKYNKNEDFTIGEFSQFDFIHS